MERMWKMVRFKSFMAAALWSMAFFCLFSIVTGDEPKLSRAQIEKREKDFEKVVTVLSDIVSLLTGNGRLTFPPSPSSPTPSRSPRPSSNPSPSGIPPSPSRVPSSPSKSPTPGKSPSVSPNPSPLPEQETKPSEEIVEAPDKPGSTKIPGVPYAIFDHGAQRDEAESAVIFLHDLAGEAKDMIPIMDAIQEGMFPNTRFVIPEANEMFVSNIKSKTNSWHNILDSSMDGSTDRDSQLRVANFIDKIGDHLAKQGIDRGKIVIIGYGQGSTVALTAYLRQKWGGVLGIAGFLSMADSYPSEMTDGSENAPGVLVSGEKDKVVPVDAMRTTAAKFEELGRDVSYIAFADAGHDVISNERIGALATGLLNRVIATDP